MRTAIFLDTETTGLPLFDQPSEHPDQPHIVQLAARLVDLEARESISSFDVTILPEGWTIPDEVAAIHGITTERAQRVGIPESLALQLLLGLWNMAPVRIAHNAQFDSRIVRIGLMRHAPSAADAWKAGAEQCTQILSTPILKLPPTARMRAAGRNHFKSANLGEAYEFFTGQKLDGAHNAMVDVDACIKVFYGVQDHKARVAA